MSASSSPTMQVAFDNAQLYSSLFSRNNKKQAHKNIRCFPMCSERGHVEQGFCGQPIVFRVSRPFQPSLQAIYAWGELKRADLGTANIEDDHEPAPALAIQVGTRVTRQVLLEHAKDPKSAKTDTLDKPLFEGFLDGYSSSSSSSSSSGSAASASSAARQSAARSAGELKFSFNQQKKGWSYNWVASKHNARGRHAFFVYLFVDTPPAAAAGGGGDVLECVGVHMSPTFILYCRRKRKSSAGVDAALVNEEEEEEEEDAGAAAGKKATRKGRPRVKRKSAREEDEEEDAGSAATTTTKRTKAAAAAVSAEPVVVAVDGEEEEEEGVLLPAAEETVVASPQMLSLMEEDEDQTGSGLSSWVMGAASSSSSYASPSTLMTTAAAGDGGGALAVDTLWEDFDSMAALMSSGVDGGEEEDDDDDVDEEDLALPDMESAVRVEPAKVARLELVLQAIYSQLTREGTADLFDLDQFSLDWFVRDLDTVKEEMMWGGGGEGTPPPTTAVAALTTAAPSPAILVHLANYMLEESTLTASVRQIVESTDRQARRQELIRMFDNELAHFLLTAGYSERELDLALHHQQQEQPSSPVSAQRHLAALEDQLARLSSRRPAAAAAAAAAVPPVLLPSSSLSLVVAAAVDVSGHWRLDDSVLSALDECRSRRGVPFMMRKLMAYTESRVVLEHTSLRVTWRHKTKLFSSGEEVWELDNQERAVTRAFPVPWSHQTLQGETCRAWLDYEQEEEGGGGGVVRCLHTHGGLVCTSISVSRDDTNRLAFDVQFLEQEEGDGWRCVFAKRGYGVRIASID